MTTPIPINLAVEDVLSEALLRKILQCSERPFAVGTVYARGGNGYIKKLIAGLNHAAKGTPFLVLTDLDNSECAPKLIGEWLKTPCHCNLIFRVAVREVEGWVLADRDAFATFFRVDSRQIPEDTDAIKDPKAFLVKLVRGSRQGNLRRDVVPPPGSTSQVGPNYNGCLSSFVGSKWDASRASRHSRSLARAWEATLRFEPTWDGLGK
jgi:hypothetical protein